MGEVSKMSSCTSQLEKRAAQELRKLAGELEGAKPGCIRCFSIGGEPATWQEALEREVRNLIDGNNSAFFLYAIELPNANVPDIVETFRSERKRNGSERAYSRIPKMWSKTSKFIYVGSSEKIRQRLREHLGFGPAKTYSLHMNQWWKSDFGDIIIRVRVYDNNIGKCALLALEDHWANELQPLFGRRGSV